MVKRSGIPSGLETGDKGKNVTTVQEYLKTFGYLGDVTDVVERFGAAPFPLVEGDDFATLAGQPGEATPGTFDDSTSQAVRRFQQFAGLPITGIVDELTAAKMNQPRCGLPDLPGLAEFATSGRKWATNNIRYAFENFTPDLTSDQITISLAQAFALWAAYTPLRFSLVPLASSPEIIIRFVAGDHGDGSPFDGASGVLAHAFYPSVPPAPVTPIMGDAHFDEAETWTVTVPPGSGIDLVTVAAHEFGHSLGLGHSAVAGALMAPFYGGPHRAVESDDIEGIRSLYGSFAIEQAQWVHGTDLHVEVDANVESLIRFGFFTRVVGKPNTTNWYHFAIPTPVIVSNNRLAFARAMLRLVTGGGNAVVRDVHIYDGSARIAAHQSVNLSGSLPFAVFGVPHKPDVFWGAGISIGVTTGGGTAAERRMDFISAGIDFLS
ncbi:DUF6623 family protein [Agromyces sp. NPDC004153]